MMTAETSQILVELEGEVKRRFDILKNYYGLKNKTEVVRTLVNEKYKQLFPKEA